MNMQLQIERIACGKFCMLLPPYICVYYPIVCPSFAPQTLPSRYAYDLNHALLKLPLM